MASQDFRPIEKKLDAIAFILQDLQVRHIRLDLHSHQTLSNKLRLIDDALIRMVHSTDSQPGSTPIPTPAPQEPVQEPIIEGIINDTLSTIEHTYEELKELGSALILNAFDVPVVLQTYNDTDTLQWISFADYKLAPDQVVSATAKAGFSGGRCDSFNVHIYTENGKQLSKDLGVKVHSGCRYEYRGGGGLFCVAAGPVQQRERSTSRGRARLVAEGTDSDDIILWGSAKEPTGEPTGELEPITVKTTETTTETTTEITTEITTETATETTTEPPPTELSADTPSGPSSD